MRYNNKIANIIKIALVSSSLVLNSSCDSFLDVQPQGELPSEQLFKDATGFENALYGVYATLTTETLYGRALSHEVIEILAQYFECYGNELVNSAKEYKYSQSNLETVVYNVWKDMYANIANTNNILINLESFNVQTLRNYNVYKGEALGLRAFMHFDLLRLFTENIQRNPNASGIPYSEKFSLNATSFSDAAKVYDRIITDLLEAEKLLSIDQNLIQYPKVQPTDTFLKDRELHFNLYAVQATLARVYLQKGDLVNAGIYAKKVIESNKFSLMTKNEMSSGINRGLIYSKETIFGLYSTKYYKQTYDRFMLETSFYSYNPRPNMKAIYEFEQVEHDFRWEGFFKAPSTNNGRFRFQKLTDQFQIDNRLGFRDKSSIDAINLIRLPEMYYILSESLLESNLIEATQVIDKVLVSRGLMGFLSRNPVMQVTLDRIDAERYKEFIGEGQTFLNMKRRHSNIVGTDNKVFTASNSIYVWPIPNDEKEYNN